MKPTKKRAAQLERLAKAARITSVVAADLAWAEDGLARTNAGEVGFRKTEWNVEYVKERRVEAEKRLAECLPDLRDALAVD